LLATEELSVCSYNSSGSNTLQRSKNLAETWGKRMKRLKETEV
jgi:hypothetical protein